MNIGNQLTWLKIFMTKKEQEPFLVRKLSLEEFNNLKNKVKDFLEQDYDEHSINKESLQISIYSDGNFTISADFKSYVIEDIHF